MKKVWISALLILAVGSAALFVYSKKGGIPVPAMTVNTTPAQNDAKAPNGVTETPMAYTNAIALTILKPTALTSSVAVPFVVVSGKTAAGAEVFVNDMDAVADSDGQFSVTVPLDEGENPIVIVANDSMGNSAEAERTVTYDAQ